MHAADPDPLTCRTAELRQCDMTVDAPSYYSEYFGHPVRDLEEVVQSLRAQGKRLVWTAGDSSLDNKVWFNESHDAVNGYESILRPPVMKADVTYWLNHFMAERGSASGAEPSADSRRQARSPRRGRPRGARLLRRRPARWSAP